MKTKQLITFLFTLLSFSIMAQNADRVVGYYLTVDDKTGAEKSQVQILKASNGTYFGKIVWLKEPTRDGKPKVDTQNPEKSLQNRPILGLAFIQDFKFSDNKWKNGKIYDPNSGKTYNCEMTLEGNKLKVTGYVGASWMGLGKTATWTKESALRK